MATFSGNPALLIAAPILQDYLVDITSGLPLAAGQVEFFHDNDRAVHKDFYYQVGLNPPYTYVSFTNPMTLSAVGTFVDNNGNDTIPYFYPYDASEDPDPYYVTIDNSSSQRQYTRENFPYVGSYSPNTAVQELINLIPNGQFLSHNDLPAWVTSDIVAGQVQNGVQQVAITTSGTTVNTNSTSVIVAQGGSTGWYFVKDHDSISTDLITFTQLSNEPASLYGNPRYAITLNCSVSSSADTFKELRVRFNNVNRFSSSTQQYTIAFAGISNVTGSVDLNLNYIKYFGVGGSAPIETLIDSFTLTNSSWVEPDQTPFQASFEWGSNATYTVGTDNDDYIEVSFGLPVTSEFNISLTDVILTPNVFNFANAFPERPDNIVFSTAIAGSSPTPAADGSDLYLPLVLTPAGVEFDHSSVGFVTATVTTTAPAGYLVCDGTQYATSDYSTIGVPYSRLQSVLFNTSVNMPIFGTGYQFINMYLSAGGSGNVLILTTNQPGAQTATADGAVMTGFTFSPGITGSAGWGFEGYAGASEFWVINTADAASTGTNGAGNSGFTAYTIRNGTSMINQVLLFSIASLPSLNTYIQINNGTTQYYFWFVINGVAGTDPAPGGTGVKINLLSTFTPADVAAVLAAAISGNQVSYIATTAASGLTANSYFNMYANGLYYYVWFALNGVGTDPKPASSELGIEVGYTTGQTSAQLAGYVQLASNRTYFAVPDLRGVFIRGWNNGGTWDPDAANRWAANALNVGDVIGSMEIDEFGSHNHTLSPSAIVSTLTVALFTTGSGNDGYTTTTTQSVGNTGYFETRPVNMSLNYVIKY